MSLAVLGTVVQLGVFSIVDTYPRDCGEPARDRYREVLDLAVATEQAGLDSFWVAEHHFHPSAACPSPPVLLAAAGARTQRIRLGSLVSVLPFHTPLDLAEQYALLDQLTQGRLNFGVGSGYVPFELEAFGVPAEEKRARFDRHLDAVLAAFAGNMIPVSGGANAVLNVLPRQRPYPPIWIGVQRGPAIIACARKALSIAILPYATCRDRIELAEAISEYRGNLPSGRHGSVLITVPLCVGTDPKRALQALQRHLDSRPAFREGYYSDRDKRMPPSVRAETLVRGGLALVQDEPALAESLAEFEDMGVDGVLGIVDFGGLSEPEVHRSVFGLSRAGQAAKSSPGKVFPPLPRRGHDASPPSGLRPELARSRN